MDDDSRFFVESEDRSEDDDLYAMYFGVSCAFFAVRVLSLPEVEDEKWSTMRDKMLRGSAQLLGLLVWRARRDGSDHGAAAKLENAEREIAELRKLRREDAKANEKVVSIFAAQEQGWLLERRKLRQHIGALISELRYQEKRTDQIVNEKVREIDNLVNQNEKKLEEEGEKLKRAEAEAEELREKAKHDSLEHASDLRKQKTAFIELVSNQRHLEAELNRAVRLVEAKKRELESVSKQKEESVMMVQKLSSEMVKMHEDLEQKDKILSATLRKSKVDSAEKQILLKEVKVSKAKRKQAELETERWKAASETRHERNSLRNMFAKHAASNEKSTGSSVSADGHIGFDGPEFENESEIFSPSFSEFSLCTNDCIDVKQVGNWVRSEADRYAAVIEQRHNLEIDAFVEQLRIKDEKLEAFRWRLLSMEMESKRLQSHIEGLNKELLQHRHNNINSEAMLLEKRDELACLKEQFAERFKNNVNQEEKGVEPIKANLSVQSPDKDFEENKEIVHISPSHDQGSSISVELASPSQYQLNRANSSQWKVDLHALGVAYKLKRLKQNLIMLERLRGKQEESSGEESSTKKTDSDDKSGAKDFISLMSLLNKQIDRYQSLQGKVDDLCKRMHESELELSPGDQKMARAKEKTKKLEHFLEETFQLQRYIVATGQKLMDIQAKIVSGIVVVAQELDKSIGFDMDRFSESVKTLLQEVQRGIEVRIARVIGDLEGTLACEGMIRLRR